MRTSSDTAIGRIVMVTAYDALSARIADEAGADYILVGDSAATTVLGYQNTRDVSQAEMLMLTRAARRGVRKARLIGDLPFGSYETSDAQAVSTARAYRDVGCELVKLEGAGTMCERVRAIVQEGIVVVGHIGLLPQQARTPADLRAQGRVAADALALIADAQGLAEAGVSMLVIEAVPSAVAREIAVRSAVPVIGIGAGAAVDGQVLVYTDLLGLGEGHVPRFVRHYLNGRELWRGAISAFASDVRSGSYPAAEEQYGLPESELQEFLRLLGRN